MDKQQLLDQLEKETKEYEQVMIEIAKEVSARAARINLLRELIALEEKEKQDDGTDGV